MTSVNPAKEERKEAAVGYIHTNNFPEILRKLNTSIVVSTYQAQRILVFSPKTDKLSMLMRLFDRPTGLAIRGGQMALCAKHQVFIFESIKEMVDEKGEKQSFDQCLVPRVSFFTGDVLPHEAAFLGREVLLVNTRFSCLCTLTPQFSFKPVWKPRFISALAAEDRCHLNGIAVHQEKIGFVSALAESDQREGWRAKKLDGGILIDVASGEIMSRGMSMPHSPRIHAGKLWILNSGIGELQSVDPKSGERTTVAKLPGFLRGLTFVGQFAFVGLCKIREKKEFGNLPIEGMFPELECAIYCVDLTSGQSVGFIKFTKGIEELFDIQVLPGVTNPHVVGLEDDTVQGLFVLPT